MKSRKGHAAAAGTAGHRGHDRQPVKDIGRATEAAPGPEEAATARQVRSRSRQAQKMNGDLHQDELRPATGEGKIKGPHAE